VPKQLQLFENKLDRDLEVYVEMYPDRYVLKSGDVMRISYQHDGEGYGLHTLIWDNGLQIYCETFDTAEVTINGEAVEPWSQ
jgi:hypothetical protein